MVLPAALMWAWVGRAADEMVNAGRQGLVHCVRWQPQESLRSAGTLV